MTHRVKPLRSHYWLSFAGEFRLTGVSWKTSPRRRRRALYATLTWSRNLFVLLEEPLSSVLNSERRWSILFLRGRLAHQPSFHVYIRIQVAYPGT